MAREAKKLVNFRLPIEIVFSIQEMAEVGKLSQSEVVARAVEFYEVHNGGEERVTVSYPAPGGGSSLEDLKKLVAPTTPGVSAGPPKRYGCGHCGRQKVVARFGDICASCAGTDHRGEPRDCPECAMGAGTGAL